MVWCLSPLILEALKLLYNFYFYIFIFIHTFLGYLNLLMSPSKAYSFLLTVFLISNFYLIISDSVNSVLKLSTRFRSSVFDYLSIRAVNMLVLLKSI